MAKPFRARQPLGCEVPFVVFTRDRSESGVSGMEKPSGRPCGARLDVRIASRKRRRRSLRVKTGKSSSFSLQKPFTLRCTTTNSLSNTTDLLHFQLVLRVCRKRKFWVQNRRKKIPCLVLLARCIRQFYSPFVWWKHGWKFPALYGERNEVQAG